MDNFPITSGSLHLGLVFVDNVIDTTSWVAKLSADGGTFNYVAVIGGDNSVAGVTGIAIDSSGNAYIAGTVIGSDFPTVGHPVQSSVPQNCSPSGCYSGYIAELNSKGTALVFPTYWGGEHN